MFDTATNQERQSKSWMDDVATRYANKVTENKKTIIWVEFWRIAYNEKMQELQARSQTA
jgi:hypothetical protein